MKASTRLDPISHFTLGPTGPVTYPLLQFRAVNEHQAASCKVVWPQSSGQVDKSAARMTALGDRGL